MQRISQHVWGLLTRGGFLNMYILQHGDTLALIDTGIAGDEKRIIAALQSQGWDIAQVAHILITHAHPDHIGSLGALQRLINVPTYVHRLDAPIVRGTQAVARPPAHEVGLVHRLVQRMEQTMPPMAPARVDHELNGADDLSAIVPGLRTVPLPGHSHGQVGFWLPDDGVLIAGDAVMRFPWGYTMPFRAFSPDWAAAKASIQAIIDLKPQTLCVGHGAPNSGEVAADLSRLA